MSTGNCEPLASKDDDHLQLNTYDVANGTTVHVACRLFGRRLTTGSEIVSCNNGSWVPNATLNCEYTAEFSLYEKIVVGVAGAAVIFLVLMLILIAVCGIRFRRKLREQKEGYPYEYEMNSPVRKHDGTNGIYDHGSVMNSNPQGGPYIPVAEGYVYYTGRGNTAGSQVYDNRAYEPRLSDYTDAMIDPTMNPGRPFSYTKEDKYKWDGHIPRPQLGQSDSYR